MELYNDPVIIKYSTDFVVSFDELALEFSQIKPKNIPIYDFCVIKLLFSFDYYLGNYYKWKSAPELLDQLEQMIKTSFPAVNYNSEVIRIIYNNLIEKKEPPSQFLFQFFNFINRAYKSSINQDQHKGQVDYVIFKNELSDKISDIFDKYKVQWKQIDEQVNKTSELLINNFAHLEGDETFVMTLDTVEDIENETDNIIGPIIEKYKDKHLGMLNQIEFEKLGTIDFNDKVEEIRGLLNTQFDSEVNSIYYNVITMRKLSNDITQLLMTFFNEEKSMYRLTRSLGISLNVFNYLCSKKESK